MPCHLKAYDSFLIGRTPPWAGIRFDPVDGDVEVMEGLSLLLTPGHTPGMQTVVVEAESGRYLIPGDNVPLFESWEGKPPYWPHIPDTHHYNLSDYFASYQKIEATGGRVLPSHDFKLFATPVYK